MPPAGKRKANAMLDRIEKMAKQSEFDEERKKSDKYEVERKEYFESARAMFEESEKKETKEQYSAQYRRNKNETFEEEKKLMVGKNKNITKTQEENGRESNLMEKKRKHIKHRKHIVRDVRRTW